ncbi:hypothetical protein QBC34DRAFT_418805 [Podospora aff. communis PSN243]|uniref:Nephrocystin 3-like N-terminal domain-containing protein n=1 Tax=Podospora aff. communis PSN243 TaxID=3040156 RepID=A0AAV9G5G2_9PEZI|nr:hypothetical protein QBC34DRAFT_418805 [Podospora aff. communis PSN243]
MDPLSILGITASTVQFMDFGARLLKAIVAETTRENLMGSLGDNERLRKDEKLRRDARQLADLAQAIERKIQSMGQSGGDRMLNPAEIAILDESRGCMVVGLEIANSLEGNQGRDNRSTMDRIGAAFKLVWNERSIDEMRTRLVEARSSLMLAIISNLWDRPVVVPDEPQAAAQTPHQALVEELRSNDQAGADDPTFFRSVFTFHQAKARRDGHSQSAAGDLNAGDAEYLDAILASLHFTARETRGQAIPDAYKSTFDWALQEPRRAGDDEQPMWSSLPAWLSEETENVYWITGKPGSGKSTLMKYLVARPETLEHLQKWAGSRQVLLATFYSWDAGNELQKSQTGFLRTLLYQIVEQAPDLAPRLFPGRWATQKIFGSAALDHLPPWSWEELFETFISLASLLERRRKRGLAIFVDGLDEFSGDHSRLIDLVRLLHSQPAVKVCVSSRPWNDFRDAFVSCPQLRMESLTERDLVIFVQGVSSASVAFTELKEAYPTEAQDLLKKVVDRAGGVFLWVSLVTKVMLGSLTDGATLSDLEQLLESLPEDLSRLYTSLWGRVRSKYKQDGAHFLLLFRAYTNAPILDMDDLKLDPPPGMESEVLWLADGRRLEKRDRIDQVLRRKLHSRTMGLLEMAQSGQVNYLHRTTKEWLDTCWNKIESAASGTFDPHLGILRAISRIASPDEPNPIRNKFKRLKQPGASWRLFCNVWGWILEAFYHAGRVVHDPHHHLVDALDRMEDTFRDTRFVTTTVLSVSPHWAKVSRGSAVPQFGFVALAAQLGVVSYVRAKINQVPDYVSIEGADEDLLSCLLLGPASRGLSRHEYKPLSNTPLRKRLPFIQKYVFQHIAFNHAKRYTLAKDVLDMLSTRRNGKEKKIPLTVKNTLLPLAERIKDRNDRGWLPKKLGQTPIPVVTTARTGSQEVTRTVPYGPAVLKLLESYGIGQKSGMRELFREWLEGNR